MKFLDDLVEATENQYTSDFSGEALESYIDTGCYVVNALLSGSIYGGASCNRITAFVGEPATGKSFFTLSIVKHFLESDPKNIVMYFESEGALDPNEKSTRDLLEKIGIDIKRFRIVPVDTVQDVKTQILKVLDKYLTSDEESRPKLMLCLDSAGNLSTSKEMEDSLAGKETQDMTRARLLKGLFRTITLKLKKAKVPMFVTNHTYTQIGVMYPQQIPGGGSGLLYASSTIIALSRKKEREGDEIVGNIIHCKNLKNRLAKENAVVDALLRYDKGINRYYGLCDLALLGGVFKETGKKIMLPDTSLVFRKQLNSNPEKYFTKEILDKIDEVAKQYFNYGSSLQGEENVQSTEEE